MKIYHVLFSITVIACWASSDTPVHGQGRGVFSSPRLPSDELLAKPGTLSDEIKVLDTTWQLTIPKKEYYPGEIIWGEFTVTNNYRSGTYVICPPLNGLYVSRLNLFVRRELVGSSKDSNVREWGDLQTVYDLRKNTSFASRIALGVEKFVPAGKTLKFTTPLNVGQARNDAHKVFGHGFHSSWLTGIGFAEPGTYQFFIDFWNISGGWPEKTPFDNVLQPDQLKKLLSERLDKQTQIIRESGKVIQFTSNSECKLTFGPFEVAVKPFPKDANLDKDVAALEMMLKRFNEDRNLLAPYNDVHIGQFEKDVKELPQLFESNLMDAKYGLADTLALTAIRHRVWPRTLRADGKGDFRPVELDDIDRLIGRLKDDDPLLGHAIVAKCNWLLENGRKQEAIDLAATIRDNNPDAEIFWYLAQWHNGFRDWWR